AVLEHCLSVGREANTCRTLRHELGRRHGWLGNRAWWWRSGRRGVVRRIGRRLAGGPSRPSRGGQHRRYVRRGRRGEVRCPGVAASCAAPGLVPPVALGRTLHVDGGARSATNADVLARFAVSRALAISPIPEDTPMVGEATRRVLDEECRRLSEAGIGVATVLPGELEHEAFGFDLIDVAKIPAAIEAGRERGRREAARL